MRTETSIPRGRRTQRKITDFTSDDVLVTGSGKQLSSGESDGSCQLRLKRNTEQ